MTKSIKSLLSKKGWTGEEVGKALIASLLNDIRNIGKAHDPLFSPADFERMEKSIETERDFLAYGIYRDIYNSILEAYNRGQGAYQQYHNGYYRLLAHLTAVIRANDIEKHKTEYPLIMTAEKYQRAEAETAEELRSQPESFHEILFSLLEYFMEILTENTVELHEGVDGKPAELIPAPILEAIEATKKEPVTNERILALYNTEMGEGYYQLPDGRRSDQLSPEEWVQASEEAFLNTHKLTINGKPASPEDTARHFRAERILRGYELLYRGADAIREAFKESTGQELEGTDKEILDELENIINDSYRMSWREPHTQLQTRLVATYTEQTPTEWHYYEAPPKDLTKYDILTSLIERYSGVIEGDSERDLFKEFKRDYPALYKALDAYIRETIPGAGSLKATQLFKKCFSWGELADLGLPYYQRLVSVDQDAVREHLREAGELSYQENDRAFHRGIAILKDPKSYQLDGDGNYTEDDMYLSRLETIDTIAGDAQTVEEIEDLRDRLLSPAIQYLNCYRALLRVLGDVYGIEGAEDAYSGLEITRFRSQAEAFNKMIFIFHAEVYGSPEERDLRRAEIRSLFHPIDLEALEPDPEAVEALKARLVSLGISAEARQTLKDFLPLITGLFKKKGG